MEQNRYCNDERHKHVEEKLEDLFETADDHEERIRELEQEQKVLITELKHLTKNVSFQTKALWGMCGSILVYVLQKILSGGI